MKKELLVMQIMNIVCLMYSAAERIKKKKKKEKKRKAFVIHSDCIAKIKRKLEIKYK